MPYTSINPATEKVIQEYKTLNLNEVESIIEKINLAQQKWRFESISKKLELTSNLLKLIESNSDKIARLITEEMGKVINDAKGEAVRTKLFCQFALENLEKILKNKTVPNPLYNAHIEYEPLGIIYAITPWNVPIGTPIRIALPSILTGNGVLIKPAPNVAGCAFLLQDLIIEAGFPKDLIKVVCLENNVAEAVIKSKYIKKVSFVGSGPVGQRLASLAGENIKPILLELGGSDPFIVLKDADIESAASDAALARCTNAGQVCCAAKRIIIEERVFEDFTKIFCDKIKNRKVGNPLDETSSIGPLARKDIRDKLISQVSKFKESGAKILLDGGTIDGTGFYFSPMIFEAKFDNCFSQDEEFFGPVATVLSAKDADHAIEIANSSKYGLGSSIYTKDLDKANQIAKKLEAGFTYINRPPSLHPYIPFGGVKESGFGKDCGEEGYYEYVNKKVIVS